jgi:hypothetical protein
MSYKRHSMRSACEDATHTQTHSQNITNGPRFGLVLTTSTGNVDQVGVRIQAGRMIRQWFGETNGQLTPTQT